MLALPLYGWYTFSQQGAIGLAGQGSDPFANPLLFLVPVLFCFSLALFFTRFFPWIMGALAWLAHWLPGPTILMTLRQVARSAAQYVGPLLLLSLTLSLATFTASMASTLDSHLMDSVYYQVGADQHLVELGESTAESDRPVNRPSKPHLPAANPRKSRAGSFCRSASIYRCRGCRRPAVWATIRRPLILAAASRPAGCWVSTGRICLTWFFSEDDFAGESLGGLMNRLAVDWSNILVSRDFMARNQLAVGDPLRLTVGSRWGLCRNRVYSCRPAEPISPRCIHRMGRFFIANLEYIYEGLGGTYPV